MKIEDAFRNLITRPGYTGSLTVEDLRATDWTVVAQQPAPTPTPTPTPTQPESAQGTTMTKGAGFIIDAKGVIWTLGTNGAFSRDAVQMAGTGNIVLGLYWNRQVYQNATGFGWFYWNGASWVATADPRTATTPTPTPTPTPSPTPASSSGRLIGVNIAGGEFNVGGTRGVNQDYLYPTTGQVDYWVSKGFNCIRVPILAKRLANAGDLATFDSLVSYCANKGVTVVLDLHEYGDMTTAPGLAGVDQADTDAFIAFWRSMATKFKGRPNLVFGLMNEPNKQTPATWFAVAKQAVAAISAIDPARIVTVPGSAWTGAHAWISSGNASAALAAGFPAGTIFEMHQYLDADSSGTKDAYVAGKGASCLVAATEWARANKYKIFNGEFGWGPSGNTEGQAMVDYMKANADVWIGGTYWAAGAWWGSYFQSIEPANGQDKPQLAVLKRLI